MDQLLAYYLELVRGADDAAIQQHLTNLVTDAAKLADAVKSVVDAAKARNGQ